MEKNLNRVKEKDVIEKKKDIYKDVRIVKVEEELGGWEKVKKKNL